MVGVILLIANLYYYITTESVNVTALVFVTILSLTLLFIPDRLFTSIGNFIKNNENKKL